MTAILILLTAMTASASHQTGQLALTNVRTTYGVLGGPRPDDKLLPGDALVLSFDIEGLKTDAGGKARYGIDMEVADSEGKVRFRQSPRQSEGVVARGASGVPGFADIRIGLDTPSGRYAVKVIVTDHASGATGEVTRTYELLPKGFGLVRVTATGDQDGRMPAAAFAAGKPVWINFAAVGFERDSKGQPNLALTMRVMDEGGRPATKQQLTGEFHGELHAQALSLPMRFRIDPERVGRLNCELKATDKVSGRTAEVSFPLTVSAN